MLELEALLLGLKPQIRRFHAHDRRIFQVSDSYVCISVVSKARSSSRQLNRILKQVAALLLAHGLQLVFVMWSRWKTQRILALASEP